MSEPIPSVARPYVQWIRSAIPRPPIYPVLVLVDYPYYLCKRDGEGMRDEIQGRWRVALHFPGGRMTLADILCHLPWEMLPGLSTHEESFTAYNQFREWVRRQTDPKCIDLIWPLETQETKS